MAKASLTAISNASPLIALSAIQQLELLKEIFQEVIIPEVVYEEVVLSGTEKPGANEVAAANWIIRRRVKHSKAVRKLQKRYHLGQGEAETILLAEQMKADWLILDERRARQAAIKRKHKIIGTLGILLLAKDRGLIQSAPALHPLLMFLRITLSPFSDTCSITRSTILISSIR
ncbi:MAG: DUF3368 domain-containing protein [candidate division Zixibacteria bacterium]|nr:DUF3368 domain-containing protein [candidate division Zixibacteria bacterium]NIX58781.1 DUF3368 domain-containing protein [candidate division Zixibacteria bacterium]